MKRKIQRLASILATLAMIVFGIHILGYIVRPTDTDGVYSQIETFHNLPENSLEVILYGSSHTFRGVNSMQMYQSYGIGTYNYSWHWQKLNTITLFLKDSLLTQTPKIILIDTYTCNNVLRDKDMNAEIYYSRYIHNETAKKEYLRQCFGNSWPRFAAYYAPLIAFHDNWSTLSVQSFQPLVAESYLFRSMGFSKSTRISPISTPYLSNPPQKELSEIASAELDKIVATCREKNIEIIFFTVPYQGEYGYGNAMTQYAERNGCAYLNLFEYIDEMGLNGATDFSDAGHLNTSGATKVADFLGSYIVEHYDVTDMRNIKDNIWQQALEQ